MRKGIPMRKLRKLKKWEVRNKRLYDAIQEKGIGLAELAALCHVNLKTVQRWVFEGSTPVPWNKVELERILEKKDLFN